MLFDGAKWDAAHYSISKDNDAAMITQKPNPTTIETSKLLMSTISPPVGPRRHSGFDRSSKEVELPPRSEGAVNSTTGRDGSSAPL